MKILPTQFDHEELWKVINTPEKFELISYLLVCLDNPYIDWCKTPQTRDSKKDGVGIGGNQKLYFEAKYIGNYKKKKLSHKEIGSNITIAIYEVADALWIFTNSEIQLDLLNFISNHNEVHQVILQRPLKLIAVNRRQSAMLILKYKKEMFLEELSKLKFTGYKSLSEIELKHKKNQLVNQGTKLIEKIQTAKKEAKHKFFYNPTFKSLVEKPWSLKEKTEVFGSLFQTHVYYDWTVDGKGEDSITVPVGSTFYILFKVSNYFFDKINFSVSLMPDGLIKLFGSVESKGAKFHVNSQISGISDKVIALEARIEQIPFKNLEILFSVGGIEISPALGDILVNNVFFLAPFIGEVNNASLSLFKEKVDRTYFHDKFFLGLITGRAGVGKSRLVQEILDHCRQYNLRVFKSEMVASEGRKTLIRDILSYFLGLDLNSFIDINNQLFSRFQEDKNFASIFNNKEEFLHFRDLIKQVVSQGIDQASNNEIDKVVDFIGKLLYRFGQKYLVVIVIEDLHHGGERLFYFLSKLYNNLKTQKTKVALLLATRTEAKEFSKAYSEFESLVENDPTYSITKVNVENLSNCDSLSLIKELVITESKFERIIKRRILAKTGNNPFNIIHALLHLKNRGVIIEKENDFEWHYLNRLDDLNFHTEVEHLFSDRFDFYSTHTKFKSSLINLLQLICLFESKVLLKTLEEIWQPDDQLNEMVDFLIQERILRAGNRFIQFDHESIFQYVLEHHMSNASKVGEIVIKWISKNELESIRQNLYVRSLNLCFDKYSSIFFSTAFDLFERLQREDNWREILRYGKMITKRSQELELDVISRERLFNLKFTIARIQSEYSGLNVAINSYEELEMEIKDIINNLSSIDNTELFNCYFLGLQARLYRCDAIIMGSNYLKARKILKGLIAEIRDFEKKNIRFNKNQKLKELHTWALNRLGITFRPHGEPEKALSLMKESLLIAKQIEHEYFIHHNYYDMAGCLVYLDRMDEAFEMHQKCLTPVLERPEHLNAKVRANIRTGVFHTFIGRYEEAELKLENSIRLALENNFLWELTRGLINQGCLYLKQGDHDAGYETFKTCLHYVDIHEASAFKICLFNNLAFLNLHYYSITSKTHFLKDSFDAIFQMIEWIGSKKIHTNKSTYELLAMLNIKSYQEFILTQSFPKSFEGFTNKINQFELPSLIEHQQKFIKRFRHKLNEGPDFYLMYMSFS